MFYGASPPPITVQILLHSFLNPLLQSSLKVDTCLLFHQILYQNVDLINSKRPSISDQKPAGTPRTRFIRDAQDLSLKSVPRKNYFLLYDHQHATVIYVLQIYSQIFVLNSFSFPNYIY